MNKENVMADLASKPLLDWVENSRAGVSSPCTALTRLLPPGITGIARQLHRQLDGYRMSPLKSLSGLAQLIGVGGVWVKDESQRLSLDSFKVLGGSFASSAQGAARATLDADLVADLRPEHVEPFIAALRDALPRS